MGSRVRGRGKTRTVPVPGGGEENIYANVFQNTIPGRGGEGGGGAAPAARFEISRDRARGRGRASVPASTLPGRPGRARASARWSRVTRPRREEFGRPRVRTGGLEHEVTTSPVSSAFIVMMSSLPAHLSILDCGREARGRGKGREVGRGRRDAAAGANRSSRRAAPPASGRGASTPRSRGGSPGRRPRGVPTFQNKRFFPERRSRGGVRFARRRTMFVRFMPMVMLRSQR